MEVIINVPEVRTYKSTFERKLKDGTIRKYEYDREFIPKSKKRKLGHADIVRRIRNCKDSDKLEQIKQFLSEINC